MFIFTFTDMYDVSEDTQDSYFGYVNIAIFISELAAKQ